LVPGVVEKGVLAALAVEDSVQERRKGWVGENWEVVALDWGFVQYHLMWKLGFSLGD
jgi:hypothetical protein